MKSTRKRKIECVRCDEAKGICEPANCETAFNEDLEEYEENEE